MVSPKTVCSILQRTVGYSAVFSRFSRKMNAPIDSICLMGACIMYIYPSTTLLGIVGVVFFYRYLQVSVLTYVSVKFFVFIIDSIMVTTYQTALHCITVTLLLFEITRKRQLSPSSSPESPHLLKVMISSTKIQQ